jgi:hypothetical protein
MARVAEFLHRSSLESDASVIANRIASAAAKIFFPREI